MKTFATIAIGVICITGLPHLALADAGADATSVKNVYDPLLNNYQEKVVFNCTVENCQFLASTVTKTTLIQHISCGFSMSASAVVVTAYLTDFDSAATDFINPFSYGTANAAAYRGINADTFLIYKKGMQPRIAIITSGDVAGPLSCTLSGYHQ